MKKPLTMLLALLLVCMLLPASAEEAVKKIETPLFEFSVPAAWNLKTEKSAAGTYKYSYSANGVTFKADLLPLKDYSTAVGADMQAFIEAGDVQPSFWIVVLQGKDKVPADSAATLTYREVKLAKEGSAILSHYETGTQRVLIGTCYGDAMGTLVFRMTCAKADAQACTEQFAGIVGSISRDAAAAAKAAAEAKAKAEAEAKAAAEAKAKAEEAAKPRITITADSARVRTEPSLSGGLIRQVKKGETFVLLGESGDFYKIEIDGKTGYVAKGVAQKKK